MGRPLALTSRIGLSSLLLLAPLSARAEDAPPPRLALSLGLQASHETNPDLAVTGGQSETTAGLSLGLKAALASRDQSLKLGVEGQVDADGLSHPGLSLTYDRQGARAGFSFALSSTEAPVDTAEPVVDDSGATIGLIASTGDVRQSAARIGLEIGKDGPLGVSAGLRFGDVDYSATSDASLNDSQSRGLTLGVTAQALSGKLGLALSDSATRVQDDSDTARDSQSLSLSYSRDMGAFALSASLGQSRSETRRSDAATVSSQGLTASLGLDLTQAAGKTGLALTFGHDINGGRQGLRVSRQMQLPDGAFTAELGYEQRSGGEGTAVGRLSYEITRPTGKLSLSLARNLTLNSSDADAVQSSAGLGWQQSLGTASNFGISWKLSAVEGLGDADVESVTRQSLTASFGHDITADWGLQAGVTVTRLDKAETGLAEDAKIFLSLGRSFVLLP